MNENNDTFEIMSSTQIQELNTKRQLLENQNSNTDINQTNLNSQNSIQQDGQIGQNSTNKSKFKRSSTFALGQQDLQAFSPDNKNIQQAQKIESMQKYYKKRQSIMNIPTYQLDQMKQDFIERKKQLRSQQSQKFPRNGSESPTIMKFKNFSGAIENSQFFQQSQQSQQIQNEGNMNESNKLDNSFVSTRSQHVFRIPKDHINLKEGQDNNHQQDYKNVQQGVNKVLKSVLNTIRLKAKGLYNFKALSQLYRFRTFDNQIAKYFNDKSFIFNPQINQQGIYQIPMNSYIQGSPRKSSQINNQLIQQQMYNQPNFNTEPDFKPIQNVQYKNKKDVKQIIIKRIKRHDQAIPVFQPADNYKTAWDCVVLISILFGFYYLPLKIAFKGYDLSEEIFKSILLVIFIIDIFVTLNTGIYQKGHLVLSRRKIANHYFKKKFISEIISNIPLIINLFIFTKNHVSEDQFIDYTEDFTFTLFYLKYRQFQIMKTKFYERFQFNMKKSYYIFDLMELVGMVILFSHLSACFFVYVSRYQESKDDSTWKNAYGAMDISELSGPMLYVFAFYFSIVTVASVGYGDISPQTRLEIFCVILLIMIGCVIYAYFISKMGSILIELAKQNNKKKEILSQLKLYLRQKKISQNLSLSMREYVEYYFKDHLDDQGYFQRQLLNMLSDPLKKELLYESYSLVTKNAIFTKNFSQGVQNRIIPIIKELKTSPDQIISHKGDVDENIYFVDYGDLEIILQDKHQLQNQEFQYQPYCVHKIGKSQVFGQIQFFTGLECTQTIRSKSFCTILKINRKEFLQILKDYPEDMEKFTFIQDNIRFAQEYKNIDFQCRSCNQPYHSLDQCPYVNLVLNKQKVLHQNRSQPQERDRDFDRDDYINDKYPTYKNCQLVQQIAEEYINNNSQFIEDLSWVIDEYDFNTSYFSSTGQLSDGQLDLSYLFQGKNLGEEKDPEKKIKKIIKKKLSITKKFGAESIVEEQDSNHEKSSKTSFLTSSSSQSSNLSDIDLYDSVEIQEQRKQSKQLLTPTNRRFSRQNTGGSKFSRKKSYQSTGSQLLRQNSNKSVNLLRQKSRQSTFKQSQNPSPSSNVQRQGSSDLSMISVDNTPKKNHNSAKNQKKKHKKSFNLEEKDKPVTPKKLKRKLTLKEQQQNLAEAIALQLKSINLSQSKKEQQLKKKEFKPSDFPLIKISGGMSSSTQGSPKSHLRRVSLQQEQIQNQLNALQQTLLTNQQLMLQSQMKKSSRLPSGSIPNSPNNPNNPNNNNSIYNHQKKHDKINMGFSSLVYPKANMGISRSIQKKNSILNHIKQKESQKNLDNNNFNKNSNNQKHQHDSNKKFPDFKEEITSTGTPQNKNNAINSIQNNIQNNQILPFNNEYDDDRNIYFFMADFDKKKQYAFYYPWFNYSVVVYKAQQLTKKLILEQKKLTKIRNIQMKIFKQRKSILKQNIKNMQPLQVPKNLQPKQFEIKPISANNKNNSNSNNNNNNSNNNSLATPTNLYNSQITPTHQYNSLQMQDVKQNAGNVPNNTINTSYSNGKFYKQTDTLYTQINNTNITDNTQNI